MNVLGQPRAAASRAPVSQCTRGKRTRTGDQHVFSTLGSVALPILLGFACHIDVSASRVRCFGARAMRTSWSEFAKKKVTPKVDVVYLIISSFTYSCFGVQMLWQKSVAY